MTDKDSLQGLYTIYSLVRSRVSVISCCNELTTVAGPSSFRMCLHVINSVIFDVDNINRESVGFQKRTRKRKSVLGGRKTIYDVRKRDI